MTLDTYKTYITVIDVFINEKKVRNLKERVMETFLRVVIKKNIVKMYALQMKNTSNFTLVFLYFYIFLNVFNYRAM